MSKSYWIMTPAEYVSALRDLHPVALRAPVTSVRGDQRVLTWSLGDHPDSFPTRNGMTESEVQIAINHPDWRAPLPGDWSALTDGESYDGIRWARVSTPLTDDQLEYIATAYDVPLTAGDLEYMGGDAIIAVVGDLPSCLYSHHRIALYDGPGDV